MRGKKIALKLLRWFIESGLACLMIISLITVLFGEEPHWWKVSESVRQRDSARGIDYLVAGEREVRQRHHGLFQSANAEKAGVGGCVSRGK